MLTCQHIVHVVSNTKCTLCINLHRKLFLIDDDIIEINNGMAPVHDSGDDSSETEDSDDSENEDTPVPPPRKKKQQPKSPEQKRKNIPPPRPSYTPVKSNIRKSVDGENIGKPPQSKEEDNENDKGIAEQGSDETDSGSTNTQQISPSSVVKSNSVSSKPPRPNSGPPSKPSNGSTPETSNSGNSVFKPDPGSQKPVPKPRRTVLKKETDQDRGSGSDTSASMESPPQGHKVADSITETGTENEQPPVTAGDTLSLQTKDANNPESENESSKDSSLPKESAQLESVADLDPVHQVVHSDPVHQGVDSDPVHQGESSLSKELPDEDTLQDEPVTIQPAIESAGQPENKEVSIVH